MYVKNTARCLIIFSLLYNWKSYEIKNHMKINSFFPFYVCNVYDFQNSNINQISQKFIFYWTNDSVFFKL